MKTDQQPRSAPMGCVAAAWDAYQGELRGYLQHRLSGPQDADDVLQDVFVKALRHGQRFCTLDNPRAWLFQVARNALVDRARTSHPHEALTPELAGAVALPQEPVAPVDALADCLTRTLGELAPEDSAVLRACDIGGQTQRAYARQHGLTLAAVKSRLLRARQRLRERLTRACQVRFEPGGRVEAHVQRPAPPGPGSR